MGKSIDEIEKIMSDKYECVSDDDYEFNGDEDKSDEIDLEELADLNNSKKAEVSETAYFDMPDEISLDELTADELADLDAEPYDDWYTGVNNNVDPHKNYIAEWFANKGYTEIMPRAFYRDIFPGGLLDDKGLITKGKGIGLVNLLQKPKTEEGMNSDIKIKNLGYKFHNDLNCLMEIIKKSVDLYSDNIKNGLSDDIQVLVNAGACSYIGKDCKADNIFMLSAIVVEIDDPISNYNNGKYLPDEEYDPIGIKNLLKQLRPVQFRPEAVKYTGTEIREPLHPTPTYIVCSGTGLHLYYVLDEPLRINKKSFPKHYMQVDLFKRSLMASFWRDHTITKKPLEVQSLAQRYRCVGSPTKNGSLVRAFRMGDRVSLAYLNSFNILNVDREAYMEPCPKLAEIVNTAPGTASKKDEDKKNKKARKGTLGKGAYTKAISRIQAFAVEGRRYWFIYCLAATARACSIPREQLEKDAYALLDILDSKTETNNNHFTSYDIQSALKAYDYTGPFMRRSTYESLCGIKCETAQKLNGRSREEHLAYCRQIKAEKIANGELLTDGRPLAYWSVLSYRILCPKARKVDALNNNVAAKATLQKYWSLYDLLYEKDEKAVADIFEALRGHTGQERIEGNIQMKNVALTVKEFTQQVLEYYHLLDGFKKKNV